MTRGDPSPYQALVAEQRSKNGEAWEFPWLFELVEADPVLVDAFENRIADNAVVGRCAFAGAEGLERRGLFVEGRGGRTECGFRSVAEDDRVVTNDAVEVRAVESGTCVDGLGLRRRMIRRSLDVGVLLDGAVAHAGESGKTDDGHDSRRTRRRVVCRLFHTFLVPTF